ncbi:hypothetical protein GGI35DRAFT_484973 [Trichoderma velutinum]
MEVVSVAIELAMTTGDGLNLNHENEIKKKLDDKCLIVMVSLLDQKLYGNIYDSVVVSFIAALGIRPVIPKPGFGAGQLLYDAAYFTPYLSALIKMGQLLVAERALLAV